jgi:hypothetical protein
MESKRRGWRAKRAVIGWFVVLPFALYVGVYFAAMEPALFGAWDAMPCTRPVDTNWGNSFFKQVVEMERERVAGRRLH